MTEEVGMDCCADAFTRGGNYPRLFAASVG